MKKYIKLIAIFTLFMCILNIFSPVFAAETQESNNGILDTIFGKGNQWFNESFNKFNNNENNSNTHAYNFINKIFYNGGIIDIISTVGYLVFFIAGAVLGIKYMLSGYEGKAFAKNGLVTYTIGVVFFYLAENLVKFAWDLFFKDVSQATGFDTLAGTIWSTFEVVVSTLMIAIVVIYGVKYMWSSSNQKADLKKGMVPMVIGAVLIMCTLQILQFIVDVSEPVLDVSNNNISNVEYQVLEANSSMLGESNS